MIRLLHHCRPGDRGIVARALPRFLIDCQTQTDTDGQSNGCVSADLSFMHHQSSSREASILLFRNNSTAVEHPHPVDCLTTTLRSQPRGRGWLSSHAGTADSTEAGLARSHACVPEGWPAHCHACACIAADPALTKEGNVSQRVLEESLDTQLPKRVIVTDGDEEWGLAVVRQLGSGPLSSHPARPMLCVCGDQQCQRCC